MNVYNAISIRMILCFVFISSIDKYLLHAHENSLHDINRRVCECAKWKKNRWAIERQRLEQPYTQFQQQGKEKWKQPAEQENNT